MNRYMTRHYVAVDWTEAARLAQLDGTSLSDIRCHENVELLHRTHWWAWWSDERLTTAIYLPDNLQPKELSTDAASLIFEVWISDLIAPRCGWTVLAKVKRVLSSEIVYTSRGSSGAVISRWEKLTLLFEPDEQGFLYRHNYRNELGYQCDIVFERP
jgi:hypothetical protein